MNWEDFKKEIRNDEDYRAAAKFAFLGMLYLVAGIFFLDDVICTLLFIASVICFVMCCDSFQARRIKQIIKTVENMQHHLETLGNQGNAPNIGSGRCEDLYQRNPPN